MNSLFFEIFFIQIISFLVWWFHISTIVTGTSRRKLERFNGEWEVLIIRIIDKEPVIYVLLKAFGLIASRNKGACITSCCAFFNAGSLRQSLVVRFDTIDNDPPFTSCIDGPEGHDIGRLRGAEVGLLHDLLQAVHAVLRVGQHVLVDGLDAVIVVLKSMLNFIRGIFRILQAPWFRVVN